MRSNWCCLFGYIYNLTDSICICVCRKCQNDYSKHELKWNLIKSNWKNKNEQLFALYSLLSVSLAYNFFLLHSHRQIFTFILAMGFFFFWFVKMFKCLLFECRMVSDFPHPNASIYIRIGKINKFFWKSKRIWSSFQLLIRANRIYLLIWMYDTPGWAWARSNCKQQSAQMVSKGKTNK